MLKNLIDQLHLEANDDKLFWRTVEKGRNPLANSVYATLEDYLSSMGVWDIEDLDEDELEDKIDDILKETPNYVFYDIDDKIFYYEGVCAHLLEDGASDEQGHGNPNWSGSDIYILSADNYDIDYDVGVVLKHAKVVMKVNKQQHDYIVDYLN